MRPLLPVVLAWVGMSVACAAPAEDTATREGDVAAAATDGTAEPAACTTWTLPSTGRDPYAGHPDDPFDPASCSSWPVARESLAKLLGPEKKPARFCGSTKIYQRHRSCSPSSGCGPWSASEPLSVTLGTATGDVSRPIDVHLGLMTKGRSSAGDALKLVVEEDSIPARSPGSLLGVQLDFDRDEAEDAKLRFVVGEQILDLAIGNIVTTKLSLSDACARLSGSDKSFDFTTNTSIENEYAAVFRF